MIPILIPLKNAISFSGEKKKLPHVPFSTDDIKAHCLNIFKIPTQKVKSQNLNMSSSFSLCQSLCAKLKNVILKVLSQQR